VSLRDLARASGVSASMVSQLEREKTTPSITTLCSIASVLKVSLDELLLPSRLLNPNDWEGPSEGPVLRADNRVTLQLVSGVLLERLTSFHDRRVNFLHIVYPAGAESCAPEHLSHHPGSERGFVASGRLGATISDESYELGPGDSIAFDGDLPHRLWAMGDEPATAIWIVLDRDADPPTH
jgi:transcriptional regulator with XRE-family HTH domain